MNAPTLQAAQIINPPPEFTEAYFAPLACAGLAVAAIAVFIVWMVFGSESGPPLIPFVVMICIPLMVGAATLQDAADSDGPSVDVEATAKLIEKTYRITAVEIDDDDAPSVEGLCQPVSLGSPEFVGVSDGQKVTFRVGVPDCDTPDPELVITETTGRAIDVDDLSRTR